MTDIGFTGANDMFGNLLMKFPDAGTNTLQRLAKTLKSQCPSILPRKEYFILYFLGRRTSYEVTMDYFCF